MLNASQRPSGENAWSWISPTLSCATIFGAPPSTRTVHSLWALSENASVLPSAENTGPYR